MEDSIGEEEIRAVNECLNSKEYTHGRVVEDFEKRFAEWNGSKYAVMVNSGSSANLLMISLLKQRCGFLNDDEIIVPSVTWPTTVYPILQNGMNPVFCDVDESFNLDVNSLKRMISEKTKAVFLVHLLGQSAKIEEIKEICDKNRLILIEDCCESLGARFNGIKVGNFGKMASFSFYFGHHITTIEGGMVVTDDFEFYELLKSMRSHGWTRGTTRHSKYPDKNKNFTFDVFGYNFRNTNLNASIGIVQLNKLDSFIRKRIENHNYFLEKIKDLDLESQKVNLNETSSFSFAVILKSKEERDFVLENLPLKGVECRPVVGGNLLKQPVFKNKFYKQDKTTMADIIDNKGIYLPNNQYMNNDKIDYMIKSIKEILSERI